MYVATRKIRVQHGKKQDFVDAWHRAIGRRLQKQTGFITAWLTTSINDDEVMITSQWRNENDYRAWCTSETYHQVYAHIGRFLHERIADMGYHILPPAPAIGNQQSL